MDLIHMLCAIAALAIGAASVTIVIVYHLRAR